MRDSTPFSHNANLSYRIVETRSGCLRLLDAPGIEEEGATNHSRSSAAANQKLAHDAVLQADLVVLCFDTQNQKPSEFAHVSSYIQELGKPCICLLNVRNPLWRCPVYMSWFAPNRKLSDFC